ncbi:Cytochrome c peroxidase mitochondrial [Zalerion maritima]|uniref:Peroxidase n=1 Tax=Zalerion maritima TaxID=339359 RepID=A0AAD5WT09_9PEZI|nr:Cytochrome c peroxidase mitochondrial [Zalerion maritima]
MAASVSRQFARAAMRTSARPVIANTTRQAFRSQGRRFYSSEPAKSGGVSPLVWLSLLGAGGAGGYYFYSQGGGASIKNFVATEKDYQDVYNEISRLLEEKDEYDDGSYAPVLLRLAWHCSGTYDKESGTGGSNGATMRFDPEANHGANAGLTNARDFLEPVKAKFPWITYSDLWILAGVAAVQEAQGPVIPFRPGRADKDMAACTPDGRLPDASQDQKHVRDVFYRMGFNDQEIVALIGAHALGRCHSDRSGYEGPWTFSPTMLTNDFYNLLLNEKWQFKKWDGPAQYEDKKTKSLMMLPTDMAFIMDKAFKKHVEQYAKDQDVFFKDFAAAVVKLFELGVPFSQGAQKMEFKPTWAD